MDLQVLIHSHLYIFLHVNICDILFLLILVIIVPFAGLDLWGLLHSVSKSDMIRMIIKVLEAYLKLALEQSDKNGPNARQLVCIMDMEGFSMRQYAWRPGMH